MDGGEFEIGGGKARRVQQRAARGSLKAKPKRKAFTKRRQLQFLNHFAASCNARAAARATGISENCVYVWRRDNAPFRAAWNEALEQGYARLEAELVREAGDVLKIRPDRKRAVRIGAMDAKTGLAVLEAYRRSAGRGPGEVWPQAYNVEDVRARLEAKMIALRLIDARGRPVALLAGEGRTEVEEDPSTASRSRCPGSPGEDDSSTASSSPCPREPEEE